MTTSNKVKSWRFWVPMLIQTMLIIAVPLHSAVVYSTGRAVTLKTVPVDPYDMLRGYSQTLRYEISDPKVVASLPGGNTVFADDYQTRKFSFYIVLQAPEGSTSPPSAWTPIRVSRDRPSSLPPNQVALKGNHVYWDIEYGLETFYMPEQERDAINDHIREEQQLEQETFVVDIKVDNTGKSVLNSLWVGDRNYRF